MIQRVCDKPGLYVGQARMRHVRSFLDGYAMALGESHELPDYPFGGFLRWLEQRHHICHPAWGWDRIHVHAAGSDAEAIHTLPATFALYRTELERGLFAPDGDRVPTREPEQTCTEGYHDR
ncbi:MAG: hypothetical protein QM813_06460 [Verrucomicrobiota bacterium]